MWVTYSARLGAAVRMSTGTLPSGGREISETSPSISELISSRPLPTGLVMDFRGDCLSDRENKRSWYFSVVFMRRVGREKPSILK